MEQPESKQEKTLKLSVKKAIPQSQKRFEPLSQEEWDRAVSEAARLVGRKHQ